MFQPIKFRNNKVEPDNRYVWVLFLLWPFYALVFAIKNYRYAFAKNILWLFIIFYGYSMVIVGDAMNGGADATRYRDSFIEMSHKKFANLDFNTLLFNEEEKSLDILQPFVSLIVSRLTNNYHILFAVFGLIFGFFYSRNIWFLIEHTRNKIKSINITLLITFVLIVGFWNINGFRFWTATHVFLYGALLYLLDKKKLGLVIVLMSPLIHFSFLFPVSILLAYILIGNRTSFYFYFFLGTLFITELDLEIVKDLLNNYLPNIFNSKVENYTNQDYADSLAELAKQYNWYIPMSILALKYAIVVLVIAIYYKGKRFISRHHNLANLFSFALLLSAFANIASMMPSGGRFIALGNLLLVPLIFWYIQYAPHEQMIKRMVPFAIPALSLFCIVAIRESLDTIGLLTIFGNPILAPFVHGDLPIIEVIKKIL